MTEVGAGGLTEGVAAGQLAEWEDQLLVTTIRWTEYLRYRSRLRGYELSKIEHILKHSTERYNDSETFRSIVVGRHDQQLVMIAYGVEGDVMTPVTIHATTRQQIRFRIKTGRFTHG